MTCDKVLAALVTGNPLDRRRARRHAARCPKCAETLAFLDQTARELAVVPPLTASQRSSWLRAGLADASFEPARSRTARLVFAAAAAVLVLVGLVALRLSWRSDGGGPMPIVETPAPQPLPKPGPGLDDLRAGLDTLERELAGLRRGADLLDARHDADELWARYAKPQDNRTL